MFDPRFRRYPVNLRKEKLNLLTRVNRGRSDDEFLDAVWETIEDANSKAEGFSQISRDMIVVLDEEIQCPITDKSSIKRAAVYRDFKDVIDNVYVRLESSQEGSLVLNLPELETWIVGKFADIGIVLENMETDFFSAGVDSLKAIQMRAIIIKSLDIGGNAAKCPSMVVHDSKNAAGLAKALLELRSGTAGGHAKDDIDEMKELIEKFSVFEKRSTVKGRKPESFVVVSISGITGRVLMLTS